MLEGEGKFNWVKEMASVGWKMRWFNFKCVQEEPL